MARGRSIQNGVLAAVIVGELLFLVGHFAVGWGPSRRSPPATPAPLTIGSPALPSGRQLLRDLSRAAGRSHAAGTSGRYDYVALQTWSLHDQRHADGDPRHPVYRVSESWRAADGSGREVSTRRTGSGYQRVVRTLPAGHGAPPSLAGGRVAIAHRLHLGYPSREPLAEQFRVFTDVFAAGPVPPGPRASMLALLSRLPGTQVAGAAADRLGRRGVAVSITSSYTGTEIRYTLVFDTETGALLESDEMLAGDAGALGVPSGSLLTYTVYRDAGRVDAVGQRPRRP